MTTPRVKCTVDQCTHYWPGDYCNAAHIDIYNEAAGDATAASAGQTQCRSFHPRKTVGDIVGAVHNVNIGGLMTAAFTKGRQVTPGVACFVNSCTHWASANQCNAPEIHVQGLHAAKHEDTDCETFQAKV